MKIFIRFAIVFLALSTQSCTILKQSQKDGFVDDVYSVQVIDSAGTSEKKVYLERGDDTIFVYELPYSSIAPEANREIILPAQQTSPTSAKYTFRKRTLDIDIITIPLKLRPSVKGFPPQLNTNFNGNIFIGSRWDSYHVEYLKSPIGKLDQDITHHGYSIGGFGGIGTTAMNPWVTQNAIESEYDGVIALAGISGTAAIDNFTFGLGIGVDFLLDKNRDVWIYQNQPWLGLTFGVNLN